MKRTAVVEGKILNLCSVIREDFGEKMVTWINDQDVTHFLSRGSVPANPALLMKEFESLNGNPSEIQLAIVDKKTGTYIGITGLHSINQISRHCEFRILIGEKSFWGLGYGSEACRLIVSYAFETLAMNKVWLGVNIENKKAFDSYKRTGFKHEGILRQELFRNGRFYDIARMSLLRDEYLNVKKDWPS